jgi:hypothetical protein
MTRETVLANRRGKLGRNAETKLLACFIIRCPFGCIANNWKLNNLYLTAILFKQRVKFVGKNLAVKIFKTFLGAAAVFFFWESVVCLCWIY